MAKPGTLTCSPLRPSPLGARTWALTGMNGAATSKPGWHSWTLKYAGAARGAGAGPRFGVFWKGDRSGSQAGCGRENAKVLRVATLPEEPSVPAAPLIASKAGGEKKGEAGPLVTARAVSAAGRPAAGSPRETPRPRSGAPARLRRPYLGPSPSAADLSSRALRPGARPPRGDTGCTRGSFPPSLCSRLAEPSKVKVAPELHSAPARPEPRPHLSTRCSGPPRPALPGYAHGTPRPAGTRPPTPPPPSRDPCACWSGSLRTLRPQ